MMADNLSQAEVETLRKRLDARYYELRHAIREELLRYDDQRYSDLAGLVHDPGDESVADLISDLEVAEVGRHVEEIRAIESALQRMSAGTYGLCGDCGEPIPTDRLEAYPTATRCITCQERYERTHEPPAPY